MKKVWLVQWFNCDGEPQQNLFDNRNAAEACYDRLVADEFVDEDFQHLDIFCQSVESKDKE